MNKKEMMALAERIACKHRKFSADEVMDRCMAIMHAVAAMEDLLKSVPKAVWSHAPSEMPPMPDPAGWRQDGVAGLTGKPWRADEVVEISAGMDDIRWRGTIQEIRDGKFPHNNQGLNKWRFLKVEPEWLQCIGLKARPAHWDDADYSTVLCHYRNDVGGADKFRAERLGDVNWRTVLEVKRVFE